MVDIKIRQPIVSVLGHVDHGKCITPDTLVPLPDGRILTAEEIYQIYSKGGRKREIKDGLVIEPKKRLNLFSLDKNRIVKKRVTHLWRLKSPERLIKIKLASGDEITTTEEHPFFVLTKDCEIKNKKAVDLTEDDYVIVPSKLNFDSPPDNVKAMVVDKLKTLDNFVIKLNDKGEKWRAGVLNKNDEDIQKVYIKSINNAFGLSTEVVPQRVCDTVVTNGGKTFSRFLTDIVGFPKSKSSSVYAPKPVSAHKSILKRSVEGWFDTDGYVSKLNHTIEITSKSKRIVKEIGIMLLGFGIHSSIYKKNGYFVLRIGNNPYLNRFLSNFNPILKEKKRRITNAVEKSYTSRIFDLTPLSGDILKNIGIKSPNKKIPYFNIYYRYKRLSKQFLKKLIKILPKNSELKSKLKRLLGMPISCIKVLSKESITSKWDFVYDFTIPTTHNFIAERFIVHNTTLLDSIRGTSINLMEPGQITQHISASFIPIEIVKKICGVLLNRFKVQVTIPGLLFVDTPGHASFMNLRRRGGNVADIAILVIDITEGFQEQTDESLTILKQFKVPFVVAATKIDKIPGWFPYTNACFLESFERQRSDVKEELENKVYQLVSQLTERGFSAERFDRIEDFKKQIAIVPTSGKTKEGIPELLMVLTGLSQQFLKERLTVSEVARGSVLEVKETKGFGITIDVILYDGNIRKGDHLIIGGKKPIVTKIKALLRPRPLQELRVEKQFESVDEVTAAAGIKIAAPNLENVIAGSPLVAVKSEKEIENAKQMVQREVEEVEFTKAVDGVVLKADTLGSLEAMVKLLTEENISIRKAEVGHVTKQDIVEVQNIQNDLRRVVFAFNVGVSEDAEKLAKDLGVKIFKSDVIYRLVDEYREWCYDRKEREMQEKLDRVTRPVKIKVLSGCVFRVSRPCIVGVEVLSGYLKPGIQIKREDGKIVGRIKEIQKEGKNIQEAKTRDKVAISMDEPTAGRTFNEGDVLTSVLTDDDIKILREVWDRLTEDERGLLKELGIN
jgi:translation initiation factor 5B